MSIQSWISLEKYRNEYTYHTHFLHMVSTFHIFKPKTWHHMCHYYLAMYRSKMHLHFFQQFLAMPMQALMYDLCNGICWSILCNWEQCIKRCVIISKILYSLLGFSLCSNSLQNLKLLFHTILFVEPFMLVNKYLFMSFVVLKCNY